MQCILLLLHDRQQMNPSRTFFCCSPLFSSLNATKHALCIMHHSPPKTKPLLRHKHQPVKPNGLLSSTPLQKNIGLNTLSRTSLSIRHHRPKLSLTQTLDLWPFLEHMDASHNIPTQPPSSSAIHQHPLSTTTSLHHKSTSTINSSPQ